MPTDLSSKTRLFTESVIREMTRRALKCGAVNLAQGFPDFRGAGGNQGSGEARDRRGIQPVRDHARLAELPPRNRGQGAQLQRHRMRPRPQHHGDLRRDRGDDRDDAGGDQPGRRGDHLRAVLRELRARRDPGRGDAALRGAARSGFFDRSGRARSGVRAAHQGDRDQHSAQSERQGLHARRARSDRGAMPAA